MISNQNILHPAVLPPTQLYNEIVDNYRYLPVDFKLPVDLALSNIHVLLNVSSIVCYILSNKIVFVLRIPLLKPISFTYIIPSNRYIAMTKDRSEYCNLDSLKECIAISPREYICDVMTVFPVSANPSCESELMTNVIKAMPVQCQTDFVHGNIDLWTPLHDNNWIYVQSQNNKLYVECPNQKILEISIISTGILTVPNNCIAYCKSTKLIPKFNNVRINATVIHPDFNIINQSCCTLDKFSKVISNESPMKLQNIDLDVFTLETKSKLRSISDQTDKILNQHPIIKYETHYSVIFIIFICSVLIYCTFKMFLYIKSRSRLTYLFPRSSRADPVDLPVEQTPAPEPAIPLKIIKRPAHAEDIPSPSIRRNV
ncbi:hypothetical protein ABMA27_007615 [Loxostege sticticalis]|uniref:Envelope fusion protein n=1 Tax=Loxostege sticticalis TaxID=481309 RepID=A0ABR3HG39_LOXSC